jgi:iron-sulfur cluster assembly accessory protein
MEQKTIHEGEVTKDWTIGDIIQQHPEVVETIMEFGVHCVGCHVNAFESLEMGFKGHGMTDKDVDDAVKRINEVIKENAADEKGGQTNAKSGGNFYVTDAAAAKIKEVLQKEKKAGLRVSVLPGGCSGFKYGLELADKAASNDIVIDAKGAKLFVDMTSMQKLDGAKIDYLDTLQGAGFKIDNPHATSTCGCGSSFG